MAYPFRVVFLENERLFPAPVSVLISIPKKRVRSAVQRNRLKRLAREAYRLNKHLFNLSLLGENRRLDVAFIYVKDEGTDYATVEKGMRKAMRELGRQLEGGRRKC